MTRFNCEACNCTFATKHQLYSHRRSSHVIGVEYDPDQVVECSKDGLVCPVCSNGLKNGRTLQKHLATSHEIFSRLIYEKPSSSQTDHVSECSLHEDRQDDDTTESSCKSVAASSGVGVKRVLAQTDVDEDSAAAPSDKRQYMDLDHDSAILASADALLADDRERKMILASVEYGSWTPVIRQGKRPQAMLTSSRSVSELMDDEPGAWLVPTRQTTDQTRACSTLPQLEYLMQTCPARIYLQSRQYTRMTGEHALLANRDWQLISNAPHILSQLFAGAILLHDHAALLIIAVEPYGRLRGDDCHFERTAAGAPSSHPEQSDYHGLAKVTIYRDDNVTKLVIGTRTASLLVTASARLDVRSVNYGPNTTHFHPTPKTSIFVDVDSVEAANRADSFHPSQQVQAGPVRLLLRQLRSKFDERMTYMCSRAVAGIAARPDRHPSTIWTLFDHDSGHSLSHEKLGSRLFQHVATGVLNGNGLERHCIEELLAAAKDESAITRTMGKIVQLFEDKPTIPILHNAVLNSQLTILADRVSKRNKDVNIKREKAMINVLYG